MTQSGRPVKTERRPQLASRLRPLVVLGSVPVRTGHGATIVLAISMAATIAGCGSSADSSIGSPMGCSTYNTVKTNAEQYTANTYAVSDLLSAHGINPGGNHHYNAAAGDYVMNVTVASNEVTSYCANNPGSTINEGVKWSNFKTR